VSGTLVDELLGLTENELRYVFASMSDAERVAAMQQLQDASANPFFRYRGNPLAFVQQALGEATWSMQREVLQAVAEHDKVVVAASHSVGKSFIASRAVAAVALSWPADMVKVQTTATNFRQVKGILWPYIARLHAKYGLPGEVHTVSWKVGREEVAEGFSARHTDEAAVSGFHAMGELFLVVDEGGGIHRTLGRAFTNILTGNGHALVIGNFPTETDDTWFNEIWNSSEWHSIRISAFDTPNFPRPNGRSLNSLAEAEKWLQLAAEHPGDPALAGAFEEVGRCTVCSPLVQAHTIAKHLTDIDWVRSVAAEFGEDSPYYQTRVLALPAKNLTTKTLPITWLEAAFEEARTQPPVPGPIRLGMDIAADGGDEFVIARATGWRATITHRSSGSVNQNEVDVAGVALQHILDAEDYHAEHGIEQRVVVKVDENGLGRGVSDLLKRWGEEGKHSAEVVGVNSSRRAHDTTRFKNQRSEMWWTVRGLLQPQKEHEDKPLLMLERGEGNRLLAQLNGPRYETSGTGQLVVESKSSVKASSGHSPDQADALLLALYEPPRLQLPGIAGVTVGAENYWAGASRTGTSLGAVG
jgi:hypothetical protein